MPNCRRNERACSIPNIKLDCGFTYHTDNNLRQTLRLKHPNLDGEVDSLSWDTFGSSERYVYHNRHHQVWIPFPSVYWPLWTFRLEESVRDDLRLLKEQKFVRQELRDNVKGYVYDIKTGKLKEVVWKNHSNLLFWILGELSVYTNSVKWFYACAIQTVLHMPKHSADHD